MIAASVVVLHVAVLWAMQNGLLYRASETVVPTEILSRIVEIEAPKDAAPPPAPPPPKAAARLVEVTQGETEYINPPRVVYPPLSKRSGEAGVVIIAVYYSAAGYARRAEVFKSSGFESLSRAAREAVMASQVIPFRRASISEDTQFLLKAPTNFVLE